MQSLITRCDFSPGTDIASERAELKQSVRLELDAYLRVSDDDPFPQALVCNAKRGISPGLSLLKQYSKVFVYEMYGSVAPANLGVCSFHEGPIRPMDCEATIKNCMIPIKRYEVSDVLDMHVQSAKTSLDALKHLCVNNMSFAPRDCNSFLHIEKRKKLGN